MFLYSYLKMYLNYIAQAVDAEGAFLREMRLAQTESELCSICDRHLLSNPDAPFAAEPYRGLLARPCSESARFWVCAQISWGGKQQLAQFGSTTEMKPNHRRFQRQS